jgi:hypothetical protein
MISGFYYFFLAESRGFEPLEPFGSTVFKTAAIDHSASSPSWILAQGLFCAQTLIFGIRNRFLCRRVELDPNGEALRDFFSFAQLC